MRAPFFIVQTCRLLAPFLAVLALMLPASHAVAGDVYMVSDVPISATDDTAAAARNRAFLKGHEDAAAILFRRLTLPKDWKRIPFLSAQEAQKLVLGLELANVKVSSVRYRANLSIRFNPQSVRAHLRNYELPYSDIQSRAAILLPILQKRVGERLETLLWEDGNFWRAAFAKQDLDNILTPLLLPLGGVAEQSALSAEDALRGDANAFSSLSQIYGTPHILLAHAIYEEGPLIHLRLSWRHVGFTPKERDSTISFFITPEPDFSGQKSLPFMEQAVQTVLRIVSEGWKRRAQIDATSTEQEHLLEARFRTLEEWRQIIEGLQKIAVLESHRVRSVGRRKAQIEVRFRGTTETFALALAQEDIRLSLRVEDAAHLAPTPRRRSSSRRQEGDLGPARWVMTLARPAI